MIGESCYVIEVGNKDKRGVPDRTVQPQFGSRGCILLNSGDGPVWDPGNGLGWEGVVFSHCGYFYTVRG